MIKELELLPGLSWDRATMKLSGSQEAWDAADKVSPSLPPSASKDPSVADQVLLVRHGSVPRSKDLGCRR